MRFDVNPHRAALALLLAPLLLLATGTGWPAPRAAPADTILVNGRVLTLDPQDTVADAVAIRDGKILAVGSNDAVRSRASRDTRVIDLHGRTATPGLIDTHAHIADGGVQTLYSVELGDATDIAEVKRRVAARVSALKAGQWLLGHGWDEGKFSEGRYIFASDLDDIAPANPVWLEHTTGHYGAANTAALKLAGISASTPNPAAGTIDRDGSGEPTGVLKEAAADLVRRVVPEWSIEQEREGIIASVNLMHREGMTGVKDPNISAVQWDAYQQLAAEGKLLVHVCVLWHTDPTVASAQKTAARLQRLPKPPRPANANLVSCGAKLFMDGSGGARTAWMYEAWNKSGRDTDSGNTGYPLTDPAVYQEQVRLLHAAGIHVATHAIGDRAIDWVVDTYAAVLKERPVTGLRHAIIHANTPTDHAIELMAALERDYDAGYPETQAPFAWWIGDNYAGNLGPKRSLRLNPYRTYLDRGIRWGGGSDYDVTPLPARYGLWASVVRAPLRGTYGLQPFGTAQAVDALTALKSYTIWAAHQLFLDNEAGSLAPGKSADIAVWDRDMTTVPVADIKEMKCELTLFRGRVVHRADGSPVTLARHFQR